MGTAVGARAEDQAGWVRLRIDPAAGAELPFTAEELGEAILLRIDRARLTAPVVVSVDRLDGGGNYRIGVGERRCDVALDAAPGPYAVRTVALLAVDLVEAAPPRAPVVTGPRGWAVGLTAFGIPGGEWGDGRLEGQLAVRLRLAGRWWGTAAAGYGRATRAVFGQSLTLDTLPLRAGVTADLGWGALEASAALRYFRAGGTSGAVPGGWLELRPVLARGTAGTVALVLAAELAAQRLEVRPRKLPAPVFSSGHLTPWLGLALSSP
jgi:hypothetical protein